MQVSLSWVFCEPHQFLWNHMEAPKHRHSLKSKWSLILQSYNGKSFFGHAHGFQVHGQSSLMGAQQNVLAVHDLRRFGIGAVLLLQELDLGVQMGGQFAWTIDTINIYKSYMRNWTQISIYIYIYMGLTLEDRASNQKPIAWEIWEVTG